MQSASDISSPDGLPARFAKGFAVGVYVVDGWLRDGGMAAIYRAHREIDGTRVALKVQLLSTAHLSEIGERFDREAETLWRVCGSPNLVEVLDTGTLEDGRRYAVLEWLEGENLEELLDLLRNEDQRLPVARACQIGHHIAMGLAALHVNRLVHLDLKPANVMVGPDPEGIETTKLVDFGIVADLDEVREHGRDQADDGLMGTSAYMAPEQVAGALPNVAMDLFALGVVLYEAITGSNVPPDGWTPESLPPMESLRRSVPPELAALVRACMSSDPRNRPASAAGVAAQLLVLADGVDPARSMVAPSSSDDILIRTGRTAITPLAPAAAYADLLVRTGATEIVLTHEQVLSISGGHPSTPYESIYTPTPQPRFIPRTQPAPAMVGGRRRGWWWIWLLAVPLLGAGIWLAMPVPDQRTAAPTSSVPTARSTLATEGPAATTVAVPSPPNVPRLDPAPVEGTPVSVGASRPDDPATDELAEEAPLPTVEKDVEPDAEPPKARPKRPDRKACAQRRTDATAAYVRRDWDAVLSATNDAACWSGASLDRRRLRVKAYLNKGAFRQCVRAAGNSSDADVMRAVGVCNERLRSNR